MLDTDNSTERLLKPLIKQFVQNIEYKGAIPGDDLDTLLKGMHEYAYHTGIPYCEGRRASQSFRTGVYYALFCYPNHPLDVRIYTGIYAWLAVLVDHEAEVHPAEWQEFLPRFHGGLQQASSIAQSWAEHLRLCYKYYSPVVANFIVTSSLNFTNATTLELSTLPKIARTAGGQRWPFYIRDKVGVAEAFAYLSFPRDCCPDISCYIEAISDMNTYLNLTNDILSFYKEEKAGEKHNYIHNRAFYERRNVYAVLQDIIEENLEAHHRICLSLDGKDRYARAWHEHAMGFVTFHTAGDRYRLCELGLGERYTDETGAITALRQSV
ncbi:isoprenoid synthase domain-containing protein [Truncatella angustata]|uniref:Isoprenoid synthase domain-containing protein n=1 Tax=Truncatella angustata TaxID=152316 RepID=A0A9P8RJU6_9PEZI|nr:isoprenoid synthase domain-containing protein [Truncatella angustata]KAH6639941.1 isoprenoid synthase domain-containing protein [Truncatella angustata]